MNKVVVVGSMNMDMVLNVKELPKKGETLLVNDLNKVPGGKGANQAVAAKRLGCDVHMIARIGRDDNGKTLIDCLKKDCINTDYVVTDEEKPTGIAIITVNTVGDNTIQVVAGANMSLDLDNIDEAERVIKDSDVVVAQFETPLDVTVKAFKIAKENKGITILNPAPAKSIPEEVLNYTDIIIPNETEALELTGVKVEDLESAKIAAKNFMGKGVKYVIITLGEKGAAIISEDEYELIGANKVNAIDTTAAGDSFIGAVSTVLSREGVLNYDLVKKAVKFGNKVSSIAVTKVGAQSSLPYMEEVIEIYGEE